MEETTGPPTQRSLKTHWDLRSSQILLLTHPFFHLHIEDVFLALLYRGIPKEKKTTKQKGLRIQEIILYM